MPPNTVYVGRPSKWGNPYLIVEERGKWAGYGGWAVYRNDILLRGYYQDKQKAAQVAVEEYRAWITDEDFDQWQLEDELRGKNLACWCPLNQPCHADVLLKLANLRAMIPTHPTPEAASPLDKPHTLDDGKGE